LEAAERHLNILFKALPEEDGESVDIMPLIYRFTMDVSTEFLFGESVNSQLTALESSASNDGKREEEDNFADAMNYAQEYIAWRIRLGALYWIASNKKFERSCKIVKDFADRFVKIALQKDIEKEKVKDGKEKFVLLDALVAETRDPVELRDQILQTLLAGRDTTSSLLSWALLLLARSPTEFKNLREAVLSQFGTEKAPKQELTFSSLKSCKAITHVLYETLRLCPLIPVNSRTALRDTFLPTGGGKDRDQPIAIMKGETVGYSAYVMHRRKDIWGEDADEWRPARWEGRKLGWEWIAFSGGPRVCLGRKSILSLGWEIEMC
jgi:cytochrome P450